MALNILQEISLDDNTDTGYDGFSKTKANFATLDTEIYNARGGEASTDARITVIEGDVEGLKDGTAISDEAIVEAKLSIANLPTNGYILQWNSTLGKPQWVVPGSAEDSGAVKMNSGDSMDYMDDKLGPGLENDGSDNLQIALATGTGLEFSSDNLSADPAIRQAYFFGIM